MFWALLQVRNAITRERKVIEEQKKEIEKLNKQLLKEKKEDKVRELTERIERIQTSGSSEEELAFPGYILLIDEPENCLHPMAVRAARDQLYALAKDDNWQVMLSTHSPYFINPLEDHTTIVRLERTGKQTTPRTFRTATTQFSDEDKQKLRALLQMDVGLSEMFFGSYPILVEGDTELAAFIASVLKPGDDLSTDVSIVSAKGKSLIAPLVRLLEHFRIPFGVLHDSDSQWRRDGKKAGSWVRNGSWTENIKIAEAIVKARQSGLEIRHRISIPDFERRIGSSAAEKDKPILAYERLTSEPKLSKEIRDLFQQLLSGVEHQPFHNIERDAAEDEIIAALDSAVKSWARDNDPNNPRFFKDDAKAEAAGA